MLAIDLIIPAYKNCELLKNCVGSILDNIIEINDYNPRIIIINDSPDDYDVQQYLAELSTRYFLGECFQLLVYTNNENVGFIKTVNSGLKLSQKDNRAAILINADTVTFKNTLKNLIDTAYSDQQIGFACPRSNNAALATLPHFPNTLSGTFTNPNAAYHAWRKVAEQLPEITYTPTAVGFYLLIKDVVLQNFNTLDEIFGKGYEEENDLIMRANKVGYLAALINTSFAYHHGSASFLLVTDSLDSDKNNNLKIMSEKHPEFLPLVREYENSPAFISEKLLGNILSVDGKHNIIFDLRRMWLSHNGTTRSTRDMIKSVCLAGAEKFNFFALCSDEQFKFHGLDKIDNLNLKTNIESSYEVSVKMAQPFDMDEINVLEKLAPLNIYGMLDIIAMDCGYLRVENDFLLERYWAHVFKHADGIFYISEFTRKNFINRFSSFLLENKNQIHKTILLPTDVSHYGETKKYKNSGKNHILIMGNHFKHKGSIEAAKAISERFGSAKIVCLSGDNNSFKNINYVKSGDIPNGELENLFSTASMVVLPSFYEGFGISLVEALSYKKPVIVRNIPPVKEILSTYKSYSGVYTFSSTKEMCDHVENAWDKSSEAIGGVTLEKWGEEFCKFIELVIHKKDKYYNLCERLISSRSLNEFIILKNINDRKDIKTNYETIKPNTPSNIKEVLKEIFSEPSNEEFIKRIFQLLLGREVDAEGFNHYNLMLKKEKPRFQVFSDILASQEIGIKGNSSPKKKKKWMLFGANITKVS